ncbi:hypothetical protein AB0B79_36920 [Streptomyces sp. NPDC039022]
MRKKAPGGGSNTGRGDTNEAGMRQTAVDLMVVVEYGVSITVLGADARTM